MSDATLIEQLEAENELLSPVAKKSGTVNPIAAAGLLGTAGMLAFFMLGTGAQTAGAMTDPTDETWRISTMQLGEPETEVNKTRKGDNRLRLSVPTDAAEEQNQGSEAVEVAAAEPELETFDPPAPKVSFDMADMPSDDAAVPIAAPASSAPPVVNASVDRAVRTIPGATFAPTATEDMAPVAVTEGNDEVPAPTLVEPSFDVRDAVASLEASRPTAPVIDRAAPSGAMASQRQPISEGSGATFQTLDGTPTAAIDDGSDEEKWRRYRSGMIMFDASNGAPAEESPSESVIQQDAIEPVGRVGGNFGYFSGARD